jgi:hypothetical protein
MKTYDIETDGLQSRIVETSSNGTTSIIGDFPTAIDAQTWLDSYLQGLHSLQLPMHRDRLATERPRGQFPVRGATASEFLPGQGTPPPLFMVTG